MKSTTARILDVWSQVASLDKKGKRIIRDKLNAECGGSKIIGQAPLELTTMQVPIEEGQ